MTKEPSPWGPTWAELSHHYSLWAFPFVYLARGLMLFSSLYNPWHRPQSRGSRAQLFIFLQLDIQPQLSEHWSGDEHGHFRAICCRWIREYLRNHTFFFKIINKCVECWKGVSTYARLVLSFHSLVVNLWLRCIQKEQIHTVFQFRKSVHLCILAKNNNKKRHKIWTKRRNISI